MPTTNRPRRGSRGIARASTRAGLLAILSALILLVGQFVAFAGQPDKPEGHPGSEVAQEHSDHGDSSSEEGTDTGDGSEADVEAEADAAADEEADVEAEADAEAEGDVEADSTADSSTKASANQTGSQDQGSEAEAAPQAPVTGTGYDAVLTSPTPPAASTTFTWTISGDSAGSGGEISHIELSGCWTGAQVQSVSSSAGTASFNSTTGLVKVDNLSDADTPFTVTVVFTQSFASSNTGTTVFVKTGGGSTAGGSVDVGGPVCPGPTTVDLSISKGPATQSVNDGGTVTFDVTVTNHGNAQATGVVVTDTLPSGLTPATVQFGATTSTLGNCTNATPISGQNVTCNVGTLAAGASVVVRITATETGTACQYQNTASVSATNETGTQHSNTSGQATVNVNCVEDLSISKGPANQVVAEGGTVTFDLTVTNGGSAPATGVVVTDTLVAGLTPATVQFGATTSTLGNCTNATPISGQNVTCNVGTLAAGASVVVRITATETGTACQYQNTALVSATGIAAETSNSVVVTVQCANQPALALSKSGTATVGQGGAITYTVSVTNSGTAAANNVVVTDNLHDSLSGVTATSTVGTCAVAATTNVVTCTVGTLNAGATATITIHATAPTGTCPTITNQAMGTHAGGTIPSSGTVSTTVTGCAGPPPPPPGPTPEITVLIQKTNDANEDGTFSNNEESKNEGRDVDFQLVITSTSDVAVEITDLTDSFGQTTLDLLADECSDLSGMVLDPDESVTCNFTLADYSPPEDTDLVNVAEVCVVMVGGTPTACDTNPSRVRSAVVLGTTVTPTPTTPPAPVQTTTPPGGIAFTGPSSAPALTALALVLLTLGTGLLWVGRRRERPDMG